MKLILLIFLCINLFSTNSFAQKKKEFDAFIVSKNIRYKGFIQNVTAEGVTIDHYGQPKFIASDSIRSIKVKRSKALQKALYMDRLPGYWVVLRYMSIKAGMVI